MRPADLTETALVELPLSIGFLTMGSADNPRVWSGTVFHMARSLEATGAELRYIGPMDTGPLWFDERLSRWRAKLRLPRTSPRHTRKASDLFARQVHGALSGTAATDVLFSPAGSMLVSGLEPGLPVAYSSDATVALMRDYYPNFKAMSRGALREAEDLERKAITRADLIVYPTEWAARSAIDDYDADPSKVHVVPYGANLDAPPREAALTPRSSGALSLLFIGVNWQRKGGDIAIEAFDALRQRGIGVRMTVIGCTPPDRARRPEITVIPFLDKNDPAQRRVLSEHYLASDIFLLPTRQECYGIVFCEAAAHGVPVVTTATGGVPDVVQDGVTGRTLPEDADGTAYADAIESLLAADGGLEVVRLAARNDYEARLNWARWGTRTRSLLDGLVAERPD